MIESYVAYIASGLAAAISVTVLGHVFLNYWRREPYFEPPAITDWHPTGKIDAMSSDDVMRDEDENKPAKFWLLVEETRQVADISGSAIGEVRWRLATRAEVKDIVRRHRLSNHDQIRQVS